MISLAKKLLGNSTAMTLLFLSAASAMHEEYLKDETGVISSSKASSSVDPIEQERTDRVTNKSKVIEGLIRDVEILQAHEEDYIDLFKDCITPEVITSIKKNVQTNEEVLLILNKLQKNQLTENNALQEILFLRYIFVN